MKRKILSILLALCMIFSMLPMSVWAADEGTSTVTFDFSSETKPSVGEDHKLDWTQDGVSLHAESYFDSSYSLKYYKGALYIPAAENSVCSISAPAGKRIVKIEFFQEEEGGYYSYFQNGYGEYALTYYVCGSETGTADSRKLAKSTGQETFTQPDGVSVGKVTLSDSGTSEAIYLKSVTVYLEDLPKYTVTFDANGHGTAPASIADVTSGSKISAPAVPEEEGYVFTGWYKEQACKNKWDFGTDIVTAATTLYAKWMPEHYYEEKPDTPATYLLKAVNGTVSGTGLSAVYVEAGTAVTVTAVEMPDEATFSGWTADKGTLPEGTGTTAATISFNMPECDLTLTTVYTIDIGNIASKTVIDGVYEAYPSTSQDITSVYLRSGKYILTGEEDGRDIFLYNYAEIVDMSEDDDSLIICSLNNESGGVISGGWVYADNNFSNEEGAVIKDVTAESSIDNDGSITGGTFNKSVWNEGTISGGTFNYSLSNDEGGEISGGTFTNSDSNIYGYGHISGGTFYVKVQAYGGITGGTFYGHTKGYSEISGGLFLDDVELISFIDSQNPERSTKGSITGGIFRNKPSGDRNLAIYKLTALNGIIAGVEDMTEAYVMPGTTVSAAAAMPEGQVFSAWTDRSGTLPEGTDTTKSTVSFAMPSSDVILKASPAEQGTVIFASQPEGKEYPKLTLVNGKISGTELTEAYVIPGADVTVKAVLDEDEDFSAWSVTAGTKPADLDLSKSETSFSMTAGDLTLTAASDTVASGTCGTNLKWKKSSTGVLIISGTGAMKDFDLDYGSYAPWYSPFDSSVKKVVIKQGVTSIGDYAFSYMGGITEISIPDSVTSIGERAFSGCDALETFSIPKTVTSIGAGAFAGCMNLEAIDADTDNQYFSTSGGVLYNKNQTTLIAYPGGKTGEITWLATVTAIGPYAFYGNEGLKSITVPDTVTTIGDQAFGHCYSLEEITLSANLTGIAEGTFEYCYTLESIEIPSKVTAIGKNAFYNCENMTSASLPAGLLTIGDSAFEYCEELVSVTLPASLTTIGEYAFDYCAELDGVVFPDSLTTIEEGAFYCCESLSAVSIPKNVTYIGPYAFAGCSALEAFAVDTANQNFTVYDGALYNPAMTTILAYPGGKTGEIKWPATVTAIGDGAFCDCLNITSIAVPATVTTLGESAFCYCYALKEIALPGNLTAIGGCAFYCCESLKEIMIPDTVTNIGEEAFEYCECLKSVYIPAGAVFADEYAFYECEDLSTVYFGGTRDQWEDLELFYYPLLTVENGTINGTKYSEAYICEDTTVTVDAAAEYGQTFTGWTVTGTGPEGFDTSEASNTFRMTGDDLKLTAGIEGEAQPKPAQTVTAADVTATYGDTDAKITASVPEGGGKLSYAVKAGSEGIVTVDKNGNLTVLKTGTATITVTADESRNYAAASKEVTVTVNPKVTLRQGGEVKYTASSTDLEGNLSFGEQEIADGTYNLVAEFGDRTSTSLVKYGTGEAAVETFDIPEYPVKAELKKGESATDVTVGGLDELAAANRVDNKVAVITMKAEELAKTEITEIFNAISSLISGTNQKLFDFSITKSVEGTASAAPVSDTGTNLLTIDIPLSDTPVKNVKVARYHNSEAQQLTEWDGTGTPSEGTFSVDGANGRIRIFAGKFSIYGVGYELDKKDRGLEFDKNSVTVDLLCEPFQNDLDGYYEDGVTYRSSDETVATVDSTGTVTIVGTGTTVISASAAETDTYASDEAEYTLKVEKVNRKLSFKTSRVTQELDSTFTNVLNGKTDGAAAEYSSSVETVATVGNDGKVTVIGLGTTVISVTIPETDTYQEGKAQYTLTVTKLTRTLYFSTSWVETEITLGTDSSYKNTTLSGNTEGTASYLSSNPLVATVADNTGELTLHAPGTTEITVTISESDRYKLGTASYMLEVKDAAGDGKYAVTVYNGTVGTGTAGGRTQDGFAAGAEVTVSASMPSGQTFTGWTVLQGFLPEGVDTSKQTITFTMPFTDIILVAGPVTVDLSTVQLTSLIPGATVGPRGTSIELNLNEGKFILTGDEKENTNKLLVYNNAEIVGCDAENILFLQNSDAAIPTNPVMGTDDPNWGKPGPGIISGGVFETEDMLLNYGTITGGTFTTAVDNCQFGVISGGTFTGDVTNDNGYITDGLFTGDVTACGGELQGGLYEGNVSAWGVEIKGGYYVNQPSCFLTEIFLLTVTNGYLGSYTELTSAYTAYEAEVTVTAAMPEGEDFGKWTASEGEIPENVDITGKKITFLMPENALTLKAEKAGGECAGRKEVKLTAGTHELFIGNVSYGTFTFAAEAKGWSIRNAEGRYLAVSGGALVLQDTPFAWTYSNGCFRYDETTKSSSYGWFWSLFTRTQTTKWYLTGNGQALTVSKSDRAARAVFYETVENDEHAYGKYISDGAGHHTRTCTLCGNTETEDCVYDSDTHKCAKCGSYDPAYIGITVTVKVTEKTSRGGWFSWWTSTRKSWQAEIKAEAAGTKVRTVEYSTDGKRFTRGTSFTSSKEITKFYIRVTDSRPQTTVWLYENGTVTPYQG